MPTYLSAGEGEVKYVVINLGFSFQHLRELCIFIQRSLAFHHKSSYSNKAERAQPFKNLTVFVTADGLFVRTKNRIIK